MEQIAVLEQTAQSPPQWCKLVHLVNLLTDVGSQTKYKILGRPHDTLCHVCYREAHNRLLVSLSLEKLRRTDDGATT